MTIKDIEENLQQLKNAVGPDWDKFREIEVECRVDGKLVKLEFTGICGSYLEYGVLPIIQNKREWEAL